MCMIILDNPDRNQWNEFIIDNSSPSSFLQSWEWGEFQKSLGFRVHRIAAVGEGGEIFATAQVITRPLNLGKTYLEITKGPIVQRIENREKGTDIFNLILDELKRIGKKENAVLVRINPPYANSSVLIANR